MKNILIIGIALFLISCSGQKNIKFNIPEKNTVNYELNDTDFTFLSAENELMVLSAETQSFGDRNYVKVWFLYQNLSDEPYRFLNSNIKLRLKYNFINQKTKKKQSHFYALSPVSKEHILYYTNREKLKIYTENVLSNVDTNIYTDRDEFKKKIVVNNNKIILDYRFLYNLYANSEKHNIIYNTVVLSKESLSGYFFFEVPEVLKELDKYNYKLNIRSKNNKYEFTLIPK